jgi:predicted DNA-binding transcriptional regulator AlpA
VAEGHNRPPSYLDKQTLAWELCIAESTVDDFVRRGILPKPMKLSAGCVRWSWGAVVAALAGFEKRESDFRSAKVRKARLLGRA